MFRVLLSHLLMAMDGRFVLMNRIDILRGNGWMANQLQMNCRCSPAVDATKVADLEDAHATKLAFIVEMSAHTLTARIRCQKVWYRLVLQMCLIKRWTAMRMRPSVMTILSRMTKFINFTYPVRISQLM